VIHIKFDASTVDPAWLDKAAEATAELIAADGDKKSNVIESTGNIWSELKSELGKLSAEKCWYCESRQIRSDRHVDHFRPKGKLSGCHHVGYWWLAYDPTNYRYSCTYCNSRRTDEATGKTGGKGAYFPIEDSNSRCSCPDDNLAQERPLLLDPTSVLDPSLLWFNDNGEAVPTYDKTESTWNHQRASTSIELYHLNHSALCDERRQIVNRCKRLVRDGDTEFKGFRQGFAAAEARLSLIIRDLLELIDASSEYSASARSTLRGLRSAARPWLDVLIA
jgi:uncharacterized protein (TIGR02646 family)